MMSAPGSGQREQPGRRAYAAVTAAARATAATEKTALIEDFNSALRELACDLADRYPSDAAVGRAKKRTLFAIDVNPVCAIETVGPYLYAYREQILADDEGFFLENDFGAELRAGADREKTGLASCVIARVKGAWGGIGPAEKRAYKETVRSLLDSYIDYLVLRLAGRPAH